MYIDDYGPKLKLINGFYEISAFYSCSDLWRIRDRFPKGEIKLSSINEMIGFFFKVDPTLHHVGLYFILYSNSEQSLLFEICKRESAIVINITNNTSNVPDISFLKELKSTVKKTKNVNGLKVIWEVEKKLAANLGIWQEIKYQKEGKMDYQKSYNRILKEAHSFVASHVYDLNNHKMEDLVSGFILQHLSHLDDISEEHITNFRKDFERKFAKLAHNHNKEAVSKFVHFLDNCPEKYTDYK